MKTRKILALVLAVMMVLGVTSIASAAVNITVTRDNTYETSAEGNREYTYYQIFRATETENHTSTGGGYDADGTPGAVSTTPEKGITYYLTVADDAARITQLKEDGNLWFELTESADKTRYTITWKTGVGTDTDTVQAAALWLSNTENYTPITNADLQVASDGKKWTAENLPEGYYLLKGSEGQNLIAATTDITVNEKNSYPTIDKKEKDSEEGTYGDGPVNVKVGDTIYYQVEVKVPADANQPIAVLDKMSTGLTYDSTTGLTVQVDGTDLATSKYAEMTAADTEYDSTITSTNGWQIKITPDEATKGKTVVITFQATVNNSALASIDRKNDVTLKYNNDHYTMTDTVEYDIGAAAVIKYDGATADLNDETNALDLASGATTIKYLEATFALTDSAGNAVYVKEATTGTKGVYVVATDATSNTVTSDKNHNGVILIYGLDPDVTYTLTETATESGYNLLDGTATFTPTKAEKSEKNAIKVTVAEASGIVAGDTNADADNTLELSAEAVGKIENNQGSVLPSTGGIGTTIFYVLGSVMALGALVLLVTKRRVNVQ